MLLRCLLYLGWLHPIFSLPQLKNLSMWLLFHSFENTTPLHTCKRDCIYTTGIYWWMVTKAVYTQIMHSESMLAYILMTSNPKCVLIFYVTSRYLHHFVLRKSLPWILFWKWNSWSFWFHFIYQVELKKMWEKMPGNSFLDISLANQLKGMLNSNTGIIIIPLN